MRGRRALTGDRVAALVFLALSLAYGALALDIEIYVGTEHDPLTARTFPIALAWTGAGIALLMLALPSRDGARPVGRTSFDWTRVAVLCVLMVAYGLALRRVGFFPSTTAFLAAGFVLLGERDWRIVVTVAPTIAAAFQYLLHGVLGIYITDPFLAALGVIE
jgi:putative tricarboxylic transport membrane protein